MLIVSCHEANLDVFLDFTYCPLNPLPLPNRHESACFMIYYKGSQRWALRTSRVNQGVPSPQNHAGGSVRLYNYRYQFLFIFLAFISILYNRNGTAVLFEADLNVIRVKVEKGWWRASDAIWLQAWAET